MKAIGTFLFAETPEEAKKWRKTTRWVALSRQVLAVATSRIEGTWSAYIDAVPGKNHDDEWEEVLRVGAKLREEVARVLFRAFDGVPYAG